MDKKLIVLTGPTAAGKTTLAKSLLQIMDRLSFFISMTTRLPRDREKSGEDYYHTTVEDFFNRIKNDEFIEYEEVYPGKFYGTLYSELDRIWKAKKIPLRVIDVLGAKSLQEKFGRRNVLTIFIRPPTLKILEERLIARNSNNAEEIRERLKRVKQEMKMANDFDHIIVSDDKEKSLAKAVKIINKFLEPKRKGLLK